MSRYSRDKVFISYSHKDKEWLDKIRIMLKPLEKANEVLVWDDTQITTGDKWKEKISEALESAKVALLLVSPNFLASDFIAQHELPPILEASKKDGLKILWVAVRDCLYDETEIANYKAITDPATSLESLSSAEQDKLLVSICKEIKKAIGDYTHPSLPDFDNDLGEAISGILSVTPSPYGTRGLTRRYLKGAIYLINKKGSPHVSWPPIENDTSFKINDSLIGKRYESFGGTSSRLGFPLIDMYKAWNNNFRNDCTFSGHVQWFEGGVIYQLERFGAHVIYAGKILAKFREYEIKKKNEKGHDMTGGALGFPISNEQEIVSRSGAKAIVQRFIYGCIINWSSGVYGVGWGFYDLYQALDEWNGELGFPLKDEEEFISSVSGKSGAIQHFEFGCTQWWNEQSFYITGQIYEKWKDNQKILGFARNAACTVKNGRIQYFEGGIIEHLNDGSAPTILK